MFFDSKTAYPPQTGTNDAFGFAPGTLNAFSFNYNQPAFLPPVQGDAFAVQGSAFDLPPVFTAPGAFAGDSAFTGGVFSTQPTSLLDLAQSGSSAASAPSTPQKSQPATRDPFANLTIADIKSGYVPPSQSTPSAPPTAKPITPSHSSSSVSSNTPQKQQPSQSDDFSGFVSSSSHTSLDDYPSMEPHSQFPESDITPTSTNPITSSNTDFASFLSNSSQSSQQAPKPMTSQHMEPNTDVVQASAAKAPVEAETTPKKQIDHLAAIDLTAKPKVAPAVPTTPTSYSNAGMVKSTIDWSKQRDLMASFLTSPSTTTQPVEQVPPKNNPKESEDWSGYNESGEEIDWSSFPTTSTPETQAEASSAQQNASDLAVPVVSAHEMPVEAKEAQVSGNWSAFPGTSDTTTKSAFEFDTSAFETSAFDTSAFDTSAFNFPQPGANPSESSGVAEIPLTTQVQAITPEPSSLASVEAQKEGFSDFGGFTSTSDDQDWSAFSSEPNTPQVGDGTQTAPESPKEGESRTSTDSRPTHVRKRTEPKVHDLSSFELPSHPTTPMKEPQEKVSPIDSPAPSLLDLSSTIASNTSTSLFSGDFSAFSTTPALEPNNTELPAWMRSNRSDDMTAPVTTPDTPVSAREESYNLDDQPSMDELRKSTVELLGNDKSAPYMWIFDNYGKGITLTFPERHALASGLVGDLKSGKVIWLSSARVNQWHTILTKCHEDLQRGHSYLSNVMVQADLQSDQVLASYLVHPETLRYISSLAKIYKIALRIQMSVRHNAGSSSKGQTPKTMCPYFKPSVVKALAALSASIDATWNNVVAQVNDMVESAYGDKNTESPAKLALHVSPPVPHAPFNFNCYICYRGFDEEEGPSPFSDKQCHASCIAYWTNRISSKPPSL